MVVFRRAFRDELALLQQIRHPNVVQFLGAVTQIPPMMIVTEYLPKVYSFFQFKPFFPSAFSLRRVNLKTLPLGLEALVIS